MKEPSTPKEDDDDCFYCEKERAVGQTICRLCGKVIIPLSKPVSGK